MQSFIESSIESMKYFVEKKLDYPDLIVAVDGGVNTKTIRKVFETGIDISIVGSGLFGAIDRKARYDELLTV